MGMLRAVHPVHAVLQRRVFGGRGVSHDGHAHHQQHEGSGPVPNRSRQGLVSQKDTDRDRKERKRYRVSRRLARGRKRFCFSRELGVSKDGLPKRQTLFLLAVRYCCPCGGPEIVRGTH